MNWTKTKPCFWDEKEPTGQYENVWTLSLTSGIYFPVGFLVRQEDSKLWVQSNLAFLGFTDTFEEAETLVKQELHKINQELTTLQNKIKELL